MRINIQSDFKSIRDSISIDDVTCLALDKKKPGNWEETETGFKDKRVMSPFYFPFGKPHTADVEEEVRRIKLIFDGSDKEELTLSELGPVAKACGCPLYWRSLFFRAACRENATTVTVNDIITMWESVASSCHDDASRFVTMLSQPGNSELVFNDFLILLQDVVETHPGLACLRRAPEFHTRYISTVIARIFYSVNRSWSARINIREIRRSKLLQTIQHLEEHCDINTETNFFSYHHFYVIYCKFWELDADHDLVINKQDLRTHEKGVISSRIIDQVLSGAVTRWDSSSHHLQTMSYVDFVWFLISEEDKTSPTSIEYWFRCMDTDGDGRISMHDMEFFYEEQKAKLTFLNMNPLPFPNLLCQVLDLVQPSNPSYVTLHDLKKSKVASIFFDFFINIEKYMTNERRPASLRMGKISKSNWDEYATMEYELLTEEEEEDESEEPYTSW